MGPKIESIIQFLRSGGKEAVITSVEHLCEAVTAQAGTHIFSDRQPASQAVKPELEVPVLR